jgi:hypothetical protein
VDWDLGLPGHKRLWNHGILGNPEIGLSLEPIRTCVLKKMVTRNQCAWPDTAANSPFH